jgi:hypothetical protein
MNHSWYLKVRRALTRSWSDKTSGSYHPNETPLSSGQCAPTAVVIFETFGGEILKTDSVPNIVSGLHFYNFINGQRYDFTADQFDEPIEYKDIPSNSTEAQAITTAGQVDAMRSAFFREWKQQSAG